MFVAAKRKIDGVLELINTDQVQRIWVNHDKDPETVVQFVSGMRVAYVEHPQHFAGCMRYGQGND